MNSNCKPHTHFKFNSTWIEETKLHNIVKEPWIHCNQDSNSSPTVVISKNLSQIKHMTIVWEKKKKKRDEATLPKIEAELDALVDTDNL